MSANTRIKSAMRKNERELLREIKKVNANGIGWTPTSTTSMSTWKALDRLDAAGIVKYRTFRSYEKRGYFAV